MILMIRLQEQRSRGLQSYHPPRNYTLAMECILLFRAEWHERRLEHKTRNATREENLT